MNLEYIKKLDMSTKENETSVSRNVTDRLSAPTLRVGNWVTELGIESRIKTAHISYVGNYEKKGWLKPDYKAIPISNEWLIKFGFGCQSIKYWFTTMNGKELPFTIIVTEKKGTRLVVGPVFEVPIYHVHQLQNLYFALCGEELEINGL